MCALGSYVAGSSPTAPMMEVARSKAAGGGLGGRRTHARPSGGGGVFARSAEGSISKGFDGDAVEPPVDDVAGPVPEFAVDGVVGSRGDGVVPAVAESELF
jgi:hypothetical protein